MPTPTIITFDCYGTLIDWQQGILTTIKTLCERVGLNEPPSDAELLTLYATAEARAETGTYRPYREVLEDVLLSFAKRLGFPLPVADRSLLADSIRHWPAFDDTRRALADLRASGVKIGILSNIDRDLFEQTQPKLGLSPDLIITAQDVQSYKPAHAHFERARADIREMGLDPEGWLHAAESLTHDIAPAKALGIRSAWIDRTGGRPSASGNDRAGDITPETSYPDLRSLTDALLSPDPSG